MELKSNNGTVHCTVHSKTPFISYIFPFILPICGPPVNDPKGVENGINPQFPAVFISLGSAERKSQTGQQKRL